MPSPRTKVRTQYIVDPPGTRDKKIVAQPRSHPAWRTLQALASVPVPSQADQHITIGGDILVTIHEDTQWTNHIAQVDEIRCHPTGAVYIKILWYYSPEDLHKRGIRGRSNLVGEAHLLTDSIQVVHVETVARLANQKEKDEINRNAMAFWEPLFGSEWNIVDATSAYLRTRYSTRPLMEQNNIATTPQQALLPTTSSTPQGLSDVVSNQSPSPVAASPVSARALTPEPAVSTTTTLIPSPEARSPVSTRPATPEVASSAYTRPATASTRPRTPVTVSPRQPSPEAGSPVSTQPAIPAGVSTASTSPEIPIAVPTASIPPALPEAPSTASSIPSTTIASSTQQAPVSPAVAQSTSATIPQFKELLTTAKFLARKPATAESSEFPFLIKTSSLTPSHPTWTPSGVFLVDTEPETASDEITFTELVETSDTPPTETSTTAVTDDTNGDQEKSESPVTPELSHPEMPEDSNPYFDELFDFPTDIAVPGQSGSKTGTNTELPLKKSAPEICSNDTTFKHDEIQIPLPSPSTPSAPLPSIHEGGESSAPAMPTPTILGEAESLEAKASSTSKPTTIETAAQPQTPTPTSRAPKRRKSSTASGKTKAKKRKGSKASR